MLYEVGGLSGEVKKTSCLVSRDWKLKKILLDKREQQRGIMESHFPKNLNMTSVKRGVKVSELETGDSKNKKRDNLVCAIFSAEGHVLRCILKILMIGFPKVSDSGSTKKPFKARPLMHAIQGWSGI